MALRLKYAGFDTGRIEVIRDYENLLEAIGADETPTFIMPTYTAMFDTARRDQQAYRYQGILRIRRELWN